MIELTKQPEQSGGVALTSPSLRQQVELLSLNRSTLYRSVAPPKPDQNSLEAGLNRIYSKRPYCGVRRMTVQLRRVGLLVNHKRVQRTMQQLGLRALQPKPNLSVSWQNKWCHIYSAGLRPRQSTTSGA
jgi:putative transposase